MSTVQTIYLVHHCHTDIGYTHDQPIVWELQRRFLEEVTMLAGRYRDDSDDSAFRWTVETTAVLEHWLHDCRPQDRDLFLELEAAGRIEVTGMPANITPLLDAGQMIEALQGIGRLRDRYGITIKHAMNCDVNGQNWPLVDHLLDAGISSFSMAINTHCGGFPFRRPSPFFWRAPSGRRLFAYNGFHYFGGWRFGIGRNQASFEDHWWPLLEKELADAGYPLSTVMIQTVHPFGDNGSGFEGYVDFIRDWNETGNTPRIVFATPGMWLRSIQDDLERVPEVGGDWTDYWNFGCGSSAREQRINRESRVRLFTADAFAAADVVRKAGSGLSPRHKKHRDQAWWNALFWDEHTWGADISVRSPEADDTVSEWMHKAHYAYQARSLSLMLQRDVIASLASEIRGEDPDSFVLFNALPWDREIGGPVNPFVTEVRGIAPDNTAGRHFQDHGLTSRFPTDCQDGKDAADQWLVPKTRVPGFGFAVIQRSDLISWRQTVSVDDHLVVHNDRFRIEVDPETGKVRSWSDTLLDKEWCSPDAEFGPGQFVHETVAETDSDWPRALQFQTDWGAQTLEMPDGWKPDWPAKRKSDSKLVAHQRFVSPLGHHLVLWLDVSGLNSRLRQEIVIPREGDAVSFLSSWVMDQQSFPEATYLAFLFNMDRPSVRFDAGGLSVELEVDQLPGVCKDFATTQRWVDFNDGNFGVTIATPENPLFQAGGFHFGQHRTIGKTETPLFLGWVTNNYWETNFRAHQPGLVTAKYVVRPYKGSFDERAAHRFAMDVTHESPLVQHCGEPGSAKYQSGEALLSFDCGRESTHPVLPVAITPGSRPDTLIVRLTNASDETVTSGVHSAALTIIAGWEADFFGNRRTSLTVGDGSVQTGIPARRTVVIELEVNRRNG